MSDAATDHEHRAPIDPLAPEAPGGRSDRAPAPRGLRIAFATIALAFIMLPALIALAGGGGGPLARERAAVAPSLDRGWDAFDDAAAYLPQRLPARAHLVRANTWISRHLFGVTPSYGSAALGADRALPFGGAGRGASAGYAQNGGASSGAVAVEGDDGWIYLQGEIDTLCRPPVGFATAVARWTQLVSLIRATGRRVLLVAVPEKSTVYPEHVRRTTPSWFCAQRGKARLWRAIEAIRDPDVVALRRPLLALRHRDPGQLLYLPRNSHWNDVGALVMAEQAVAGVGAGVRIEPSEIRSGTRAYRSDISAFTGQGTKSDVAPSRAIVRRGLRLRVAKSPAGTLVTSMVGRGSALIPGTTGYLFDSFGLSAAPMIARYAAHMRAQYWLQADPDRVLALLQASDSVIIETVERDFLNRAATTTTQAIVTPRFLASVRRDLRPRP